VLALHQKRVGPSTATILSKRSLATECMLQTTVAGPPPRIYLIKEHYDPADEMSIKKPSHSVTSSGQPTLLPHHQMRQAACLWNWHLLIGSPGHYCWLESLPASYHPTLRVQSTELGDEAPCEGIPYQSHGHIIQPGVRQIYIKHDQRCSLYMFPYILMAAV
jgi:hypothetical protein